MKSVNFLHDESKSFKLIQFNVGQGDHMLIQFEDGEYAIIDFYYEAKDTNLTEPPAITYFRSLHANNPELKLKVKFVCISHLDTDHIAKFEESIAALETMNIDVGTIWVPKAMDISDLLQDQYNSKPELQHIFEKHIKKSINQRLANQTYQRIGFLYESKFKNQIKPLDHESKIETEGDFKVEILGPASKDIQQNERDNSSMLMDLLISIVNKECDEKINLPDFKGDRNDLSIVFKLICQNTGLLFTGDASLEVLKVISAKDPAPASQFIKVAHHGSKYSSSPEIWERLLPSAGVAICGISAGAKYKHPDEETISHIRNVNRPALSRYILNTNITLAELDEINLIKIKTDLFAFEKSHSDPATDTYVKRKRSDSRNDFARNPMAKIPKDSGSEGLLAFLYHISDGRIERPLILKSPGMKVYETNPGYGPCYTTETD